MSVGGYSSSTTTEPRYPPTAGVYTQIPSIDYLGTGGGGGVVQDGVNGGGGGSNNKVGGFPGGAGGGTGFGARGLVIVEW
jgi:hypothetical protein